MMPRADGLSSPSWPAAGLERGALVGGAIAAVDNHVLADHGLPSGAGAGDLLQRRNALTALIGTTLV